jgi:hypothetical protein
VITHRNIPIVVKVPKGTILDANNYLTMPMTPNILALNELCGDFFIDELFVSKYNKTIAFDSFMTELIQSACTVRGENKTRGYKVINPKVSTGGRRKICEIAVSASSLSRCWGFGIEGTNKYLINAIAEEGFHQSSTVVSLNSVGCRSRY